MTKIHVSYQGNLSCELTHVDSGSKIMTTAPKDNGGTGETFSPTDLFAASLASCMLTIMGIAAKKHQLNIEGCTADIEKVMITNPRRVGQLNIVVRVPAGVPVDKRVVLEEAARTCPVHYSIHPDIEVTVNFIYLN